jgi:hypothetical protein
MNTFLLPTSTTVVSPTGQIRTYNQPYYSTPTLTVSTLIMPSDIDSGLGDDPMAQIQIKEYIHYKFLDKWLYEFPKILKYLKVNGDKVTVVSSKTERDTNNIDTASQNENRLKADYIEDNILNMDKTRKILIRVLQENSLKWYQLPHNETVVKHVMGHFVKRQLDKKLK